jgi:hypothetical protein
MFETSRVGESMKERAGGAVRHRLRHFEPEPSEPLHGLHVARVDVVDDLAIEGVGEPAALAKECDRVPLDRAREHRPHDVVIAVVDDAEHRGRLIVDEHRARAAGEQAQPHAELAVDAERGELVDLHLAQVREQQPVVARQRCADPDHCCPPDASPTSTFGVMVSTVAGSGLSWRSRMWPRFFQSVTTNVSSVSVCSAHGAL